MKDKILKHALLNAISYKGKASAKVVLNKLLSELPHLKDKIKVIIKDIEKVVKEVNKLSHEEQKNQLESLGIKQEIKKPQERQIPDLINVKNKVVMRFAPNPNGPLSLGHCRPALWNWFFVQKYKGTYILRFDDTDPKVKIPIKEAYDWIKEDLVWLGVKPTKIVIQSSRLKTYYKYAEELIKLDGAYVCTCSPESWKKLVDSKKPCICRSLKKEENLKRFKSMFKTYKEGEAVLRIKTDISHPNPAIRDWPAFRIVDKSNHPLSKEKVWPLLNFASAIDDHEFKVTHILRGIDLSISDDRQKYIYNYFKWTYPETMYNGKLLVSGIKSSSEAREMISKGELSGWDDPRLGTIKALRKRGFTSEAIINFIKESGITRADTQVSIEKLAALNKQIIDKTSLRYFAVLNPEKIVIKNAPETTTEIDFHPDFEEKGSRGIKTNKEFYIQDKLDPKKTYRFMHLFNFKNKTFISQELDESLKATLIHWLPVSDNLVNIELVDENNNTIKGLAEPEIKKLKVNGVVQLVRIGFCKLDKKEKDKLVFYFAHR